MWQSYSKEEKKKWQENEFIDKLTLRAFAHKIQFFRGCYLTNIQFGVWYNTVHLESHSTVAHSNGILCEWQFTYFFDWRLMHSFRRNITFYRAKWRVYPSMFFFLYTTTYKYMNEKFRLVGSWALTRNQQFSFKITCVIVIRSFFWHECMNTKSN